MTYQRHPDKSVVTGILGALSSDLGIVFVAAVVLVGVYLADTVTPLGQPVWLLYFIPLIISFWSGRYFAIPTVAVVTLLFLVGGFMVSPQGVDVSHAIVYRFTFFVAFAAVAIVLWAVRRRQVTESRL